MCGLVVANVDIATAMRLIDHRGIRSRIEEFCGVNVGHVRLPIVGLGAEWDQPMAVDNRWRIAFVGEVLNFREFTDEPSDAPLVARTWADEGPGGFLSFDGFWSVAAVSPSGDIHLLTDYLNQKPLYYRSDDYAIGAASEPAAVASLGPTTPDEVYLSSVIKWGYCPEVWRTPYSEVFKTSPGEHVILRPDGEIALGQVDGIFRCTSQNLKEEIELAIQRRVSSSDVPVSVLVSGGLDSAIVYSIAKRYGDVTPYHVENGERYEAEEVAPDLTYLPPSWCGDVKALEWMQEPLDLGSLLPQCALSAALVDKNVCLTGDGADEFFGGYGRAGRYDSQATDVYHELTSWHLPRLDRIMMRNRIEVRSPFLARRVCGMALGLPRELRTDKRILREIFAGDLPPGVAKRAKKPLRIREVERDREGRSARLVELFRRMTWPDS